MARVHCRALALAALLLPVAAPAFGQVATPNPSRPLDDGSALSTGGAPTSLPAGLPDNSVAATRLTPSPVPEVSGLLLLAGPVAAGWVAYWRRRWHKTPRPATEPPNAGLNEKTG